jgi:hypothetical protein
MHFLYPSHPLRPRLVEPMYAGEMEAIRTAGFSASVCPDAVIDDGKPLSDVPPGAVVVYRGWMLNAERYQRLTAAISQAVAVPFTSAAHYLASHHCPNWYPLIAEHTPQTHWFPVGPNLQEELEQLGWDSFFIKDYVKSLKTSRGSILTNPAQIQDVISEMIKFRGEIEGGICVRRVEPFIKESERRYFVVRGRAFGPDNEEIPPLIEWATRRIPSPFFSVDLISRKDGVLRIVEIGDGQVSDLVGWTCEAFAKMWSSVQI